MVVEAHQHTGMSVPLILTWSSSPTRGVYDTYRCSVQRVSLFGTVYYTAFFGDSPPPSSQVAAAKQSSTNL